MNEAGRSYMKEFTLAMVGYTVFLLGSIFIVREIPESPLRYIVAVLPVLPALYGLSAIGRFVDRIDELQQRIQLRAAAFSAGATAIVTFTYGFLEGVGLPHLNWTFVLPIIAIFWGIGLALAGRHYQ